MNTLKTTFLLSLLTVLMVLMGSAIGGKTGMVFAFFLAAAMNFFSYWFSDRIVLAMYGAREITENDNPSSTAWSGVLPFRLAFPCPESTSFPATAPTPSPPAATPPMPR